MAEQHALDHNARGSYPDRRGTARSVMSPQSTIVHPGLTARMSLADRLGLPACDDAKRGGAIVRRVLLLGTALALVAVGLPAGPAIAATPFGPFEVTADAAHATLLTGGREGWLVRYQWEVGDGRDDDICAFAYTTLIVDQGPDVKSGRLTDCAADGVDEALESLSRATTGTRIRALRLKTCYDLPDTDDDPCASRTVPVPQMTSANPALLPEMEGISDPPARRVRSAEGGGALSL